jgi:hypothetical protein
LKQNARYAQHKISALAAWTGEYRNPPWPLEFWYHESPRPMFSTTDEAVGFSNPPQRASKNRRKAECAWARQHRRVQNIRQDFLHNVNHSPALHIQDAAWGETRRPLEYKTVLCGSKLTVRDRF